MKTSIKEFFWPSGFEEIPARLAIKMTLWFLLIYVIATFLTIFPLSFLSSFFRHLNWGGSAFANRLTLVTDALDWVFVFINPVYSMRWALARYHSEKR